MSKSVLVCDDAMFARQTLIAILTKGGFHVAGEASTGEEAVTKYRTLQPDLVTMDIVMPVKNGIEATREIIAEHPQARILMCTAMGQEKLMDQARSAGARACLVKPWNPAEVLAIAEELLA